MLTRREFTALAVASAIAPGMTFAATNGVPSLSQAARAKGLKIGSANAFPDQSRQKTEQLGKIFRKHCDILVPDWSLTPNFMTWDTTRLNFRDIQKVQGYARKWGNDLHGHMLYWYSSENRFVNSRIRTGTIEEAIGLYDQYIGQIMKRVSNPVSWTVCNEIAGDRSMIRKQLPGGKPFRYPDFASQFGVDFVAEVYKISRKHAPRAKLVLNDYDLSSAGSAASSKRRNFLKLLDALLAKGAPIDVVGMQAHLHDFRKPSNSESLRFIRKVEDRGLEVYITELDVNDWQFSKNTARRDKKVAEVYKSFLSSVLKSPAVKRIDFWGITDAENWIVRGHSTRRIQGAEPRPALFDTNFAPKDSFYAVLEAIEKARPR